MRILRLTSSDDAEGRLPPGTAVHEVVAALLGQATDEEVETTVRGLWPDGRAPGLVDAWMERYQPDFAYLKVNAFWFNYLSVPLRVERVLGPLAKPVNRMGVRAGEMGRVSRSAAFRFTRRQLVRAIGGATYFTPDEVVTSMGECIRRILAHEGVGLIVSGPASRLNHQLPKKAALAHEARRQRVNGGVARVCSELHVPYLPMERLPARSEVHAAVSEDGLHLGVEASRRIGETEAAAFLALWQETHRAVSSGATARRTS